MRPPRELEARERITRRDSEGEACGHGGKRDPDAGHERNDRVAARLEHLLPELGPVGHRQLVREVPLLGRRPKHEVRERAEHDEGEKAETMPRTIQALNASPLS